MGPEGKSVRQPAKNERMNDSIESDQSNQLPLVMAIDKDPTDVLYGVYSILVYNGTYQIRSDRGNRA